MYSFAQRSDTTVLDEPLYASYLTLTGMPRPYRDQVLAAQEHDGNKVVREQLLGPRSKPVLYAKHIAKQKILVREPYGVVQSFSKVLSPTLQELGYAALAEIYSEMRALGRPPLVILSDELVSAPEPMLRAVCAALDLPWQPSMLHWAPGPKPYDGVWAPWWYANSHKSTGFDKVYRDTREPLPDRLKPLLEECWPSYEFLRAKALRPAPLETPYRITPRNSLASGDAAAAAAAVSALGGLSLGDQQQQPQQQLQGQSSLTSQQPPQQQAAVGSGIVSGSHAHTADPRNASVLVGVRDGALGAFDLVPRSQAKVSVLDSGFMLGDGVWEGLRVHKGVLLFAAQHLERLWEGCKALDMDIGVTQRQLLGMVYQVLEANGMGAATGVHVRLMVTRGLKSTPYQDPRVTIGAPTVVILPEWKAPPAEGQRERALRLFTVHVRRGAPDAQDPGLNSHSKINCITACIQAAKAGVDEGLMLDPYGFVSTCNSTNFCIVRRGEVWAPRGGHMMRGITRAMVLALAAADGVAVREADVTLAQVYSADEAYCTGTMAGILPVVEVDGRRIPRGPVVTRLQQLYAQLKDQEAAAGRETPLAGEADD